MARPLTSIVLMVLTGVATLNLSTLQAARQAASGSADSRSSPYYDTEAERWLLDMANRERAKAGLAPLQADDGLTQAARAHAIAMAEQGKLSHQLSGEPRLEKRLAANTKEHIDESGENVAFAGSVDQAHQSLMHSPPHRANLLNADYNVAGFSVVRKGRSLYVAQDFGHSSPSYSARDAEDLVAATVGRMRVHSRLQALHRGDGSEAAAAACDMAAANSLRAPLTGGRVILRYTTSQPQVVPANASHAIDDRSVRSFSVGSCYARTKSYPTGVYWVALLFY